MKMVFLNYYVGVDDEVKEILTALGVRAYTRFPETEGRTTCGEPREKTHVWPGSNSTMFVVVEEGVADSLVRKVEEFNAAAFGEGIDAYVLDVSRSVVAGGA
ncbi:MAG: hypothetical protein KAW67_02535 [Candidatus Eisenbacteria sp.]|nr:hypothetical protein [Candidatus Eisenbacteria bacterium]